MKLLAIFSSFLVISLAKILPNYDPNPIGLRPQWKLAEESFRTSHIRNSVLKERIFGGSSATANIYPFQVGLQLVTSLGTDRWCAGTVISINYIITAADCLEGYESANVILGAHDRTNAVESGRVTHQVPYRNFILHEDYDENTKDNNIGLIRLVLPIQFNKYIRPAILPPYTVPTTTYAGVRGVITGWGYYNNSKIMAQKLRVAKAPILTNSKCSQSFAITSSNICLDGSTGVGTCIGDTGGPLVTKGPGDEAMLIGVSSFPRGDCSKHDATVYTRISSFLVWISAVTGIIVEGLNGARNRTLS